MVEIRTVDPKARVQFPYVPPLFQLSFAALTQWIEIQTTNLKVGSSSLPCRSNHGGRSVIGLTHKLVTLRIAGSNPVVHPNLYNKKNGRVVELAFTVDSKSTALTSVRVRVPPCLPFFAGVVELAFTEVLNTFI